MLNRNAGHPFSFLKSSRNRRDSVFNAGNAPFGHSFGWAFGGAEDMQPLPARLTLGDDDRRACRDVAWRSGAARRGREGREERLRTAVAAAMRRSPRG